MDDEIMERYAPPAYPSRSATGHSQWIWYEFRTKFVVEDEEGTRTALGSEMFNACCFSDMHLLFVMGGRLWDEYWMTLDEAQTLCLSAMEFAREREAFHPTLAVVPVVVEIEVCTVQQAGEAITATFDRAIQPDRLRPISLHIVEGTEPCPVGPVPSSYLRRLPKIRVESVEQGWDLMDVCGICSRGATVGDRVTHLKCNHAFHLHCAVKWLMGSKFCPSCNAQEYNRWPRSDKTNIVLEKSGSTTCSLTYLDL